LTLCFRFPPVTVVVVVVVVVSTFVCGPVLLWGPTIVHPHEVLWRLLYINAKKCVTQCTEIRYSGVKKTFTQLKEFSKFGLLLLGK
jgi:hypothetical protein